MTGFTLSGGLKFTGGFSPASPPAWTPTNLFENGRVGFWYDPSSFDNINQTAGVSTPITAFEQNIGAVFDFSGGQNPTSFTLINRFIYSEEFENAVWNSSINRISVTANDTAGPFVSTFGDRLTTIAGGASGSSVYQATSKTSGTTYTFSVYVKAGNVNRVIVTNRNSSGSFTEGVFDLSTGTWVNGGATGAAVDVGNGWYRLSQTSAASQTGTWENYVGPINNAGTAFNNVTNGNYIFVYGAQQEIGLSATTYVKVGASPWPNNPAIQTSSTLRPLVSALYNRLERTQEINDNYWIKVSITVNSTNNTAPDGSLTADLLAETASNDVHAFYRPSLNLPLSAYRFSMYVKQDTSRYCILNMNTGASNSWAAAVYDLLTLSVTKTEFGVGGSVSYKDSGIEDVGDGWRLVWLEVNPVAITAAVFEFSNSATPTFSGFGNAVYVGNTGNRLYVWNADVRPINSVPNLPPTQTVVTSTNYPTVAYGGPEYFPQGIKFDGTDDFLTVENCGGSNTSFLFAAGIQLNSIGNFSQVLFSDLNGNSGIKIWITEYGELALTLGNGLTTTTINTTLICSVFSRNVVLAWYNGTNIFVQLDDANPVSFTYIGLSSGTSSITIGKDNGASSNYLNGILYAMLYTKNLSPTQEDVDGALNYCQQSNLSPLNADVVSPVNVTQVPVYAVMQPSTQNSVNVTQVPVYAFVQPSTEGNIAVTQVPVYINIKEQDNLLVTQLSVYAISIL